MASLLALKAKLGVNLDSLEGVDDARKSGLTDEHEFRTVKIEEADDPEEDRDLLSQLARVCRQGLDQLKISALFPVQRVVVPRVINSYFSPNVCDFSICVPTGRGKTLAYLLPIFHCLSARVQRSVTRAVILVPTRDLAKQVAAVAAVFAGKSTSELLDACLTGQSDMVSSSVAADIVIATPGRFCDAVATGHVSVAGVEFFVVDEADRLLIQNSDNQRWQAIMTDSLRSKQSCIKLLFSATMTKNPLKLASLCLTRPIRIEQRPTATVDAAGSGEDKVEHRMIKTQEESQKVQKLVKFIQSTLSRPSKALVFVNSVARVKMLVDEIASLCPAVRVKPFDAHLEQVERDRTLREFSSCEGLSETPFILVCSDLATRGLDLPNIDVVVNFDIPSFVNAYVHRAGRTGRAGKGGLVVSLVHKKEAPFFRAGLTKKLKDKHGIKVQLLV